MNTKETGNWATHQLDRDQTIPFSLSNLWMWIDGHRAQISEFFFSQVLTS